MTGLLHLVRHGQTAWNLLGRAQGHIDVELDETGHGLRVREDLHGPQAHVVPPRAFELLRDEPRAFAHAQRAAALGPVGAQRHRDATE